MLLQSLVRYYEVLSEDNESFIPQQGYGTAKISYAINISRDGELLNLIPLKIPSGKKNDLVAQIMTVPEQVTRSSGIFPYFLCDNSSYVFGFDNKGNAKRSMECFEAFKKHNIEILKNVDCDEAQAVIKYLEIWNVNTAIEHEVLKDYIDDIYGGANFVFKVDGMNCYVHQNSKIKKAWEDYKEEATNSKKKVCLVTGKHANIARLHPIIKGIKGGQAMGNTLVSFNARAYESYGNEESQGYNAPVSEYATFAYGTILNYMLDDRAHRITIGDTTAVFWAESPMSVYQDIISLLLEPSEINVVEAKDEKYVRDPIAVREVKGYLEKIVNGKSLNLDGKKDIEGNESIDKNTRFYILGLSPNAARISIRFFLQDNFGSFLSNALQHYKDLNIEKQFNTEPDSISIWRILNETVSPTSTDKSACPLLAGSVIRAILQGLAYPASLYNAVIIRIRAEKNITYYKAGILKAYLLRCKNNEKYKEVLGVSLNEKSSNKPYVLGRLFAVLEKAQQDANPGINATIKDRYFTSACSTPASVFPVLLKLSSHHMSKAEYGYISDLRLKSVMDILEVDNNPFPKQLSLEEQGIFILGYYHQKNAFFKKEEVSYERNY